MQPNETGGGADQNTRPSSNNPFQQQHESNSVRLTSPQPPPVPPPPNQNHATTYQQQMPPQKLSQSYPQVGTGMLGDEPGNGGTWARTKAWMIQWRGSRRLVLVIVAIALLLDNMLLTTVGEYLPCFSTFLYMIAQIITLD